MTKNDLFERGMVNPREKWSIIARNGQFEKKVVSLETKTKEIKIVVCTTFIGSKNL